MGIQFIAKQPCALSVVFVPLGSIQGDNINMAIQGFYQLSGLGGMLVRIVHVGNYHVLKGQSQGLSHGVVHEETNNIIRAV